MPTLDKLHKEWKGKGLVVLGISSDEAEVAQATYKKLALSFPTALDPDGKVRAYYGGVGIPFNVIIDRKGRVMAEVFGVRHEQELMVLLRRAGLK